MDAFEDEVQNVRNDEMNFVSNVSSPVISLVEKEENGKKGNEINIIQDIKIRDGVILEVTDTRRSKNESTLICSRKFNTNKNKTDIKINASTKKDNGKRLRNKRHSCYFCSKMFINMARHFEKCHGDEITVSKIIAEEKKSKSRKESFIELIRAGDFNHNCNVLAMNQGEIILVRRPTEIEAQNLTYSDYGPCPHCLGFMIKKHLWHHVKTCSKRGKIEQHCNINNNIIAESNAILYQAFGKDMSSSFIENIVSKMREDDIGQCVVNDSLILSFGGMLFEKYDTTQCELIRQSMRQLGKFLQYSRIPVF